MQLVSSCDEEIITLLKNRNQKALAIIVEKYGDQLYSFIVQHLSSEELAGDALTKTLSIVWDNSPKYNKAPEYFFIWLLRMAKKATQETE